MAIPPDDGTHPPSDPIPENVPPATPPPGGSAARGPGQGRGARGERLVRHFKIDHRLTPEDRVQYDALLLDPRSTVDSLLKWLRDRGYRDVSRGGVQRHRKQFELDVKSIRRDARVAGQFAALARAQGGPTALADAGQFRCEQMFVERLFRMNKTDERGSKEWLELGRAMSALLENRQQVEQQRADWERRAKQAVAELTNPQTRRQSGAAVARRMCEILGVPADDPPPPPEAPRDGGGAARRVDEMLGDGPKRDEPSSN